MGDCRKVKGSYVLILSISESLPISVGRLGEPYFSNGFYAYVGSALGGYKSRLKHHLLQGRKPHWHIDYLLQKATIRDIIICTSTERTECRIADVLRGEFESISGFGASDCKCRSHLFYDAKEMTSRIVMLLKESGFRPEHITDFTSIIE